MCKFVCPKELEDFKNRVYLEPTAEEIEYVSKFYQVSKERAESMLRSNWKQKREENLKTFEAVKAAAQPEEVLDELRKKRHPVIVIKSKDE